MNHIIARSLYDKQSDARVVVGTGGRGAAEPGQAGCPDTVAQQRRGFQETQVSLSLVVPLAQ